MIVAEEAEFVSKVSDVLRVRLALIFTSLVPTINSRHPCVTALMSRTLERLEEDIHDCACDYDIRRRPRKR